MPKERTELADLLKAEATVNKSRTLRIDAILEQIEHPSDRTALERALADATIPAPWIARALRKHGYPVSETAIRNYREKHHVVSE